MLDREISLEEIAVCVITALLHTHCIFLDVQKAYDTVWCKHYQGLGTCSVDTAFDDSWKEEVDKKVSEFSSMTADGRGVC